MIQFTICGPGEECSSDIHASGAESAADASHAVPRQGSVLPGRCGGCLAIFIFITGPAQAAGCDFTSGYFAMVSGLHLAGTELVRRGGHQAVNSYMGQVLLLARQFCNEPTMHLVGLVCSSMATPAGTPLAHSPASQVAHLLAPRFNDANTAIAAARHPMHAATTRPAARACAHTRSWAPIGCRPIGWPLTSCHPTIAARRLRPAKCLRPWRCPPAAPPRCAAPPPWPRRPWPGP